VEPGTALASAVEVVVAAERVHLEREGGRRERDVDVAVGARREAVLAGGHVVRALRAVDDDPVRRVAERGRDLDLRDVRLGGRPRPEEASPLVEDEHLDRARAATAAASSGSAPVSIDAVTTLVPALYEHDSEIGSTRFYKQV
jgi:hypothetical protein